MARACDAGQYNNSQPPQQHNNTSATWQMLAWTDAFNLDVAGLTNLLEDLDTLQEPRLIHCLIIEL